MYIVRTLDARRHIAQDHRNAIESGQILERAHQDLSHLAAMHFFVREAS